MSITRRSIHTSYYKKQSPENLTYRRRSSIWLFYGAAVVSAIAISAVGKVPSLRVPVLALAVLADVGRFRVVPTEDLARFGYQGDQARMEADIRNLRKHGLVEQRMIEGHSSYSTKALTLTKEGQRLLKHAQIVPDQQAIYHGLVKPKEARHDAELYRLYQKVAREIERSGGKVRRVILDLELRKDVYRALARIRPDKDEVYERISVASRFDLKVVPSSSGKCLKLFDNMHKYLHLFSFQSPLHRGSV